MIKNIDVNKKVKLHYFQKHGRSEVSFTTNLNNINFDIISEMEEEFSIFSQKIQEMKSGDEIEIPYEFKDITFQSQIIKMEIL